MPRMFVLIFVLVALFAGAAPAVTLQQLTLDQMSQAATAIVRARVSGSNASVTGSTIYTHYQLQVSESWKGFTPSEVDIPGGVANGRRQSFPGMPQLTVGTEYVMFLWTSGVTGITHLVGASQGLFDLSSQSDGSILAIRPLINEMILDNSGHRVLDQGIQMSVTSLKRQVSQTLARGAVR